MRARVMLLVILAAWLAIACQVLADLHEPLAIPNDAASSTRGDAVDDSPVGEIAEAASHFCATHGPQIGRLIVCDDFDEPNATFTQWSGRLETHGGQVTTTSDGSVSPPSSMRSTIGGPDLDGGAADVDPAANAFLFFDRKGGPPNIIDFDARIVQRPSAADVLLFALVMQRGLDGSLLGSGGVPTVASLKYSSSTQALQFEGDNLVNLGDPGPEWFHVHVELRGLIAKVEVLKSGGRKSAGETGVEPTLYVRTAFGVRAQVPGPQAEVDIDNILFSALD